MDPSVFPSPLSPPAPSDVTNSDMRSSDSAQPWTLWPCSEGEWSEDEKTERRQASQRCGYFPRQWRGCKMQKQKGTSRLKKHAWMPLKRPVLLACLIPVTLSQPCLSGHYCWVYFCYLVSFLRIKQLTANIRTCGLGEVLRVETCPRNACVVFGADKSSTFDSPLNVVSTFTWGFWVSEEKVLYFPKQKRVKTHFLKFLSVVPPPSTFCDSVLWISLK